MIFNGLSSSLKKTAFSALACLLTAFLLAVPALCAPVSQAWPGRHLYREVLPNGLTVLLLSGGHSQTASVNVFVKTGGFEENDETMGIAHFYEHLFFRGTPSLSGYQFKRTIESLGGTTNAQTGRDYTHYYINLPRQYTAQGVKLLADALFNAEMSAESIDQERKAVLEEYNIGLESPQRRMVECLCRLAYGSHPYHRNIIGTESNIRSFTHEDFVKFRAGHCAPPRVTVVVVGDVHENEIIPVLRQAFGAQNTTRALPLTTAQRIHAPQKVVRHKEGLPAPNSFVVLGFVGPSVKDKPDLYRTDVMSFMLGMGRGSLLQRDLVAKDKALGSGVDFQTSRFQALITAYSVVPAGQEDKAEKDLLEELRLLKEGKFSDRDLQRARNLLKASHRYGLETSSGLANDLGSYASIDSEAFCFSYLAELDKVTKADIVATAKKYFTPGYYCVVMEGTARPKPKPAGAPDARGEESSEPPQPVDAPHDGILHDKE